MLALSGSVFFTITNSRVFTKAKDYIEKDSSINKTVGNINSIVLLPRGSYTSVVENGIIIKQVNLSVIVKGNKKFKDASISLYKIDTTDWVIDNIE